MKCLGVDIGSTTIKGAILDLDAQSLAKVTQRPFPPPITNLPPRHLEVDPREVVKAVGSLLDDLATEASELAAVFFTGQMGGVVLVDKSGRPLSNYLSWRDERTVVPEPTSRSVLQGIRDAIGARRLAELGNELQAGSALSLLSWLRERADLPKDATAATLGGFVIAQLSRNAEIHADRSEGIGTLDVTKGDWHWDVIDLLGLQRLRWPRLQEVSKPCGSIMVAGRPLPVHPCVGDHQCSLLGVGLMERELSINVSTGSQVSLLTRTIERGSWQTRFGFHGQYLNTITHLPAGRSLSGLVELLTALGKGSAADVWPEILVAADQAVDGELEVDLAFFDGPMGNRGSIRNITLDNLTVGRLFRAAFRGMADNYSVCADRLSPAGSWDRVVLSGGLAQRSACLRQFLAERFPMPLRHCPEAEDSLLGLLRLARSIHRTGRGTP